MYKVIFVLITTFMTLTSFAQEFSFKPPTITTRPATTSTNSTIPKRSGVMSPDSFKKGVSSTMQNRSNMINNLAVQKLKNDPEYRIPVSKTQKLPAQPTEVIEQPATPKQPMNKPLPPEQPPPVQEYAPRDTYTGFSGQKPSEDSSPSKTNSSGFGNIYQ